jgi:hypothetical protein
MVRPSGLGFKITVFQTSGKFLKVETQRKDMIFFIFFYPAYPAACDPKYPVIFSLCSCAFFVSFVFNLFVYNNATNKLTSWWLHLS